MWCSLSVSVLNDFAASLVHKPVQCTYETRLKCSLKFATLISVLSRMLLSLHFVVINSFCMLYHILCVSHSTLKYMTNKTHDAIG